MGNYIILPYLTLEMLYAESWNLYRVAARRTAA